MMVEMSHWLVGRLEACPIWTAPARTQPNCGFNTDSEPKGPNRHPWRITQLKISAPSNRSTLPGVPNPGSASFKLLRCLKFHLVSNETGCRGRLDVIFDSIIDRYYPSLTVGMSDAKIGCSSWKWLVWHHTDTANFYAMVTTHQRRCCTRRSAINEVDNTEFNNALAWAVDPSGPTILTRQVMSNTWWWIRSCNTWVNTTAISSLAGFFSLHGSSLQFGCVMWINKWWGFRHFLHLCSIGQFWENGLAANDSCKEHSS